MNKERTLNTTQLDFFQEVQVEATPHKPTRIERKAIEDMVGMVTWPIVQHPGSWGVGETLKNDIITARMVQQMKAYREGNLEAVDYATDEEALAYVSSVSMVFPLDHDWYEIFVHLFCGYLKGKGQEAPPDIASDRRGLNDLQEEDLARLKLWIRKKQREVVKGLDK